MNKAEAAELIAKQDAHVRAKGRFAGTAPGVNRGQLLKAHRIVSGEEPENFQAPADFSVHQGVLIPEAERAAQKKPRTISSVSESEPPADPTEPQTVVTE